MGLIGQTRAHYRVLEELGSGGMGVVYRAEDTRLGRPVALKFLPDSLARDPHALARFRREARAASNLNHPNICTIYDVGEDEGSAFIAMECLEGRTLATCIAGQALATDAVLKFGEQITDALCAAHSKNIVHRDIKPANIFITSTGLIKVLDFGLARSLRPEGEIALTATLTHDQSVTGTLPYMAPEQLRGHPSDPRVDLYAFGVVLYEMATGRQPFPPGPLPELIAAIFNSPPPSPRDFNPDLPAKLEEIILKCLEKDPSLRYQHASEIGADLRRLKRDVESGAAPQAAISAGARSTSLASSPTVETTRSPSNVVQSPASVGRTLPLAWKGALALAILVALLAGLARWLNAPAPPRVTRVVQITNDGLQKFSAPIPPVLTTDGARIYFNEGPNVGLVAEVSAMGGTSAILQTQLPDPIISVESVSPVRSELLVTAGLDIENPLWAVALPGGISRRMGNLVATEAAWSPDGQTIAYGRREGLYLARADGGGSRKIATLQYGLAVKPCWSHDGKTIRFSWVDPGTSTRSLWEVAADGTGLHPLFLGKNSQCCGAWTPGGKYFVYQEPRDGVMSIWAVREQKNIFRSAKSEPVQLTTGPLSFMAPTPSPDGRRIFVVGVQDRGELMRFDAKSHQFSTYLSGLAAEGLDFSRDGQWLAYVSYPEAALWRSRMDGSQRLQLTDSSVTVGLPRWSPDGTRIVFCARKPGGAWKIYVVAAAGGTPEPLIPGDGPEIDPTWSADGNSIFYGGDFFYPKNCAVHQVDLTTHRISTLPESQGLYSPRVSPDGRSLVALSTDSRRLMLFRFASQKWEQLALAENIAHPAWSRTGEHVYFNNSVESDTPFYRVRLSDHKVEHQGNVNIPRGMAAGQFGQWMGLAPDDSQILLHNASVEEIYALDVELP